MSDVEASMFLDELLEVLAGGVVAGDDEEAVPPGSRTACVWCKRRIVLAKVGVLVDGSLLFGWRHVMGERSRWCPSVRAAGQLWPLHRPDRGRVRFPEGSWRREEASTT